MTPSPPKSSIDPVDRLLFTAILIFVALLVGVSKVSPNDGQTFQVLSSLLSGFAGAFLARITPNKKPGVADPATVVTTEMARS